MVRITLKGGIWKNTEDEILKAAVMKYGKNQWARISSLLVRKSAKQCKSRWYEWLDPSIRKVEWTRAEDEKLLHLAKIMPAQWRSIAPMINRTAAQCLERYESLLDRAAEVEETDTQSSTLNADGSISTVSTIKPRDARDDPRRLRPGEIDPLPEAKPARPDPVDMDEDEKEMLSEARARLANTKGKKAKRKARERQLEEARRLAVLQKQRELEAAGIAPKVQRKRKGEMDYNSEIPFERRPPSGFFSTREEDDKAALEKSPFQPVTLEEMEGKRRDKIEEEERKKDAKRLKLAKESNLPAVFQQINRLNDTEMLARRVQLSLPQPNLSENDLESIAKQVANQQKEDRDAAKEGESNLPTRALLTNSSSPSLAQLVPPSPLTHAQRDQLNIPNQINIQKEAQNLLALTRAQTPLLGGSNAQLHPTSFDGVTPRRDGTTPSSLLTPSIKESDRESTPRSTQSRTPARTPLRDSLRLNDSSSYSSSSSVTLESTSMTSGEAIAASSARTAQRKAMSVAAAMKQQLALLPAPRNEYTIVVPEGDSEENDEKEQNFDSVSVSEEDREDIELAEKKQMEEELERQKKRQSQVIQRNLPRPINFNQEQIHLPAVDNNNSNNIESLIVKEMIQLINNDNINHPVEVEKNGSKSKSSTFIEIFDDSILDLARHMIEEELRKTEPDLNSILNSRSSDLPVKIDQPSLHSLSSTHAYLLDQQTKTKNKLSVLLGGYIGVNAKLMEEIKVLEKIRSDKVIDIAALKQLLTQEKDSIKWRVKQGRDQLNELKETEKVLQEKYRLAQVQLLQVGGG